VVLNSFNDFLKNQLTKFRAVYSKCHYVDSVLREKIKMLSPKLPSPETTPMEGGKLEG